MPEPADIAGAVARTLQALRAERGWSLDQLAVRSGVSKGVLVAIEQGRSNPGLGTLARIGDAFGVPVTRLVEISDASALRQHLSSLRSSAAVLPLLSKPTKIEIAEAEKEYGVVMTMPAVFTQNLEAIDMMMKSRAHLSS